MVDKNKLITLKNRDSGRVGYTIEDTGAHRTFIGGEAKQVPFEEIEKLSWSTGGRSLLKEFLIIQDPEAAEEILGELPPEYYYDENTVKTLLTEGSVEQLEDTLDFAPKGVIDLVKEEAVNLKLDSTVKRDVIKDKTHFNVTNAIEIDEESKKLDEDIQSNAPKTQRRSAPIAATGSNSPASSTVGSKYKSVKML